VRLQAEYLGLVFICGWGSIGSGKAIPAGAISELAKLSIVHCVPIRVVGHGGMRLVHGKLCDQRLYGQLRDGCKDLHQREAKGWPRGSDGVQHLLWMAWRWLRNAVWLVMVVAAIGNGKLVMWPVHYGCLTPERQQSQGSWPALGSGSST
jgi:hypothetical protein